MNIFAADPYFITRPCYISSCYRSSWMAIYLPRQRWEIHAGTDDCCQLLPQPLQARLLFCVDFSAWRKHISPTFVFQDAPCMIQSAARDAPHIGRFGPGIGSRNGLIERANVVSCARRQAAQSTRTTAGTFRFKLHIKV